MSSESLEDTSTTQSEHNSFNVSLTPKDTPSPNAPGLNMQDHQRVANEEAVLKPAGILPGIVNLFTSIGTTMSNNTKTAKTNEALTTKDTNADLEDTSPKIDDEELECKWEVVENNDRESKEEGWTLEADRQLCILWFFTTYSFNTIASLLNYSATSPRMITRIHSNEAKKRFILLSTDKRYSRSFIYYEVKRLASSPGIDWSAVIRAQDLAFSNAWKQMMEVVEHQRAIGEKRRFKYTKSGNIYVGYDNMSDANYVKLGHPRLWSVEERKKLQTMTWKGLEAVGVARPDIVDEEYDVDAEVERSGARVEIKAKRGWFS